MASLKDRKSPVHVPPIERYNRSTIIFLTVCTKDHSARLANNVAHDVLRAAWARAAHWQVGRYVVLPDHVHMFCGPGLSAPPPLARWVGFWKRLSSQALGFSKTWSLWQQGFWDTQLRRAESYDSKWQYVRDNPVRHGYARRAEDWPFQGELAVLDWLD